MSFEQVMAMQWNAYLIVQQTIALSIYQISVTHLTRKKLSPYTNTPRERKKNLKEKERRNHIRLEMLEQMENVMPINVKKRKIVIVVQYTIEECDANQCQIKFINSITWNACTWRISRTKEITIYRVPMYISNVQFHR